MSEAAFSTPKKRNPWLAAFLSAIGIVVGQVYCGRMLRASVLVVLLTALFGAEQLANDLRISVLAQLVFTLFYLFCVVDAWLLARRIGAQHPRSYNRLYVYVLWTLAIVLFYGFAPLSEFTAFGKYETEGRSMEPALQAGEQFMASLKPAGAELPARGSVIVFDYPDRPGETGVKRVIGLPGETVQLRQSVVYIDGAEVELEPAGTREDGRRVYIEYLSNEDLGHLVLERFDNTSADNTGVYTVPDGAVFVLGDNRDSSLDSRDMDAFGFVPLENIAGTADFIFWSSDLWRIGKRIR